MRVPLSIRDLYPLLHRYTRNHLDHIDFLCISRDATVQNDVETRIGQSL